MHYKKNISKAVTLIVAALLFFSFKFSDWEYDKRYSTIIHKSIAEIFNNSSCLVEEFTGTEESFYVIKQNDIVLGYFVVAQAPSKFHQFDYYIDSSDNCIEHKCIIDGDNKYKSIACASIIAKDKRDNYIIELCEKYPELKKYDIHNNKGYGTKKHLEAIKEYGITKWHRKTFGICKEYA